MLSLLFNNWFVLSSLPCSTLCPGNRKSGDILDEPPLGGRAGKGVDTNSEIKGKNPNGKRPAVPLAQQGQIRASPDQLH